MKTKKAGSAAGMDDGNVEGQTDGKAGASGMNGNGEPEPGSLQLSDETPAGAADPNDRGMPGVSVCSQQQDMPEGSMGHEKSAQAQSMPAGSMGTGDIGSSGSNGSNGGGAGGRDDDSLDGGTPRKRTCGTMAVHRRLLSTDPAYARARARIEDHARQYESGAASSQRSGVTRIPVVVHVVWNTPAQNISDAQIASQIDVLNRDFRRTNPDFSSTPAAFLPLATDAQIEFFLATSNPSGVATNGIERRQTTAASFSDDDAVKSAASGGLDAWPAGNYLNIWVCPLGGGLLGYAQFPGGPAAPTAW